LPSEGMQIEATVFNEDDLVAGEAHINSITWRLKAILVN